MLKAIEALPNNGAIAGSSHDMKTLANGVMCMSSLLETTPLSIEQAEIVHLLKRSAEELSVMMAQVLEQSKNPLREEVPPRIASFSIRETLEDIVDTFRFTIQEKPITTRLIIENRIPAAVKGDKTVLNRILTNLLSNAGKFTESGSIEVHVKTDKITSKEASLIFEVIDTGRGIEAQNLETIFQRFTKFNSNGYGIGLAIVKELVEKQGSTIAVESTLSQGTRFTFSLPYKISTNKSTQKLNKFNMTVLKNKRILIADDDEVYMKYLTTLMKQSGAQILTAKNGKEALELIPIQLFDLILIDLQMPDIDGFEIAFQTRNTLNINRHTAIVGMTAGEAERERQIASDMDDVLPKPLNAEGLINRLERVMVFEKMAFHFDKTFQIEAFDFDKKLNALHLKELYGNDTEHAAMMFETFLEESLSQWEDIWTLWDNNNRMAIRDKAHRLKPAFSMVGLTQIEAQLKDLERSIFDYSQPKLKEILTHIDKTIDLFTPILENELERLQCDYILEAA